MAISLELWHFACILTGALGFTLSALSELLQHSSPELARNALSGSLISLLGVAMSFFGLGFKAYPDTFRMWQPFVGGLHFVMLQLFGWMFWASAAMIHIVLLVSFEVTHHPAHKLAVGCLSLAAALVLRSSVPLFEPNAALPWFSARLVTRTNAVAVMMLCAALVQCVLIDVWHRLEPYRDLLSMFHAPSWILAEMLVIYSKQHISGNLWRGGFNYIVLHIAGSCGLMVACYLQWTLTFSRPEVGRMPGINFAVTFVGSFSVLLHILAFDSFDARATQLLLRSLHVSRRTVAALILSIFAAAIVVCVDFLLPAKDEGRALVIGATGLQVLATPAVHFFATKIHVSYRVWQPFLGGTRFVVLQCLGWTVYSFFLLVTSIIQVNANAGGQWVVSLFGLLSTLLIFVSLTFFDPAAVVPRHRRRQGRTRRQMFVSGEMVTSCLFILSGLLLFAIADSRSTLPLPPPQLVFYGSLLLFAAVPLVHRSGAAMYPERFHFFQPFIGGPDFVALQALGWALYGTMVPLIAILLMNMNFAPDAVRPGVVTTTGLFSILPYTAITFSLYCFSGPGGEARFGVAQPTPDDVARDAARLYAAAQTPQLRALLMDVIRDHEGERFLRTPGRDTTTLSYFSVTLSVAAFLTFIITELLCFVLNPSIRWMVCVPLLLVSLAASSLAGLHTHAVVGVQRFPMEYRIWQPFTGGYNFILLQTFAWTFLSLQVFVGTVVIFSTWQHMPIGYFVIDGAFGFVANTLLLLSISHFEPHVNEAVGDSFLRRNAEWCVGVLLTVCGVMMFVATKIASQWEGDVIASAPAVFLSLLACTAGVPLAVFSVWKQRHHSEIVEEGGSSSSSFTFLSEIILLGVIAVALLVEGFSFVSYRWLIYVGCLALSMHAIALLALLRYEQRNLRFLLTELRSEFATFVVYSLNTICSCAWLYVCFGVFQVSVSTLSCYVSVMLLSTGNRMGVPLAKAINTVSFIHFVSAGRALEKDTVGPAVLTMLLLVYCYTYNPVAITDGSRTWMTLREWTGFWDSVAHYFTFKLRLDDDTAFGEDRKIIFGFHPHGVCPYTCLWAPLSSLWRQTKLPRFITVHVSSLLLAVPIVRDFLLALGVADVSQQSLSSAFQRGSSIMLVPGGVAEMLSEPQENEVRLVTRHKGMFRLALVEGASLVPVLSFGENQLLSSVNLPPGLRKWLANNVGVSYPQLPHGRLLLPLPRRVRLQMVVGKPIVVEQKRDPKPSEIDQLHQAYYAQVSELFHKYKDRCGYPDMKLIML